MELSEETKKRIDQQISSGRYKTADEVLDEAMTLLEEEAHYGPDMTMEELEQSLIEARKGPLTEVDEEYWEALKKRLSDRTKAKA